MVPRLGVRPRVALALAACAVAELALVAAVAAKEPAGGAIRIVFALVLAPLAVAAVAALASRVAGGWYPVCAAAVYVLLPPVASRFMLVDFRGTFDRHALPALVGAQATGALAIGVAVVAAFVFLPRVGSAAAGVAVLIFALAFWGPDKLGGLEPMLHEEAWSVALPEWLVVASIVGVAFRAPALGAALGGFAVAVIVRASHHTVEPAGFWHALAALVPAAGVLVSSIGLLVPRFRRAAPRAEEPPPRPSES